MATGLNLMKLKHEQKNEITDEQSQQYQRKSVTSTELDKILY